VDSKKGSSVCICSSRRHSATFLTISDLWSHGLHGSRPGESTPNCAGGREMTHAPNCQTRAGSFDRCRAGPSVSGVRRSALRRSRRVMYGVTRKGTVCRRQLTEPLPSRLPNALQARRLGVQMAKRGNVYSSIFTRQCWNNDRRRYHLRPQAEKTDIGLHQ
jgi:hypothetical protein